MLESDFLTIRAVKACCLYYYYYGETSKRKFFKVKKYDSNGQVVSDWYDIDPNYWTNLEEGEYIRIYGYGGSSVNKTFNYDLNNYYYFYFGPARGTNFYGSVEISGHLTSLISSGSTDTISKDYSFCYLFKGNTSTPIDASQLIMPTNTTRYCYEGMFRGCKELTAIPTLPATTLSDNCYEAMFYLCTGLTQEITLSATTLAEKCYNSMFYDCDSLTDVKILAPSLDYPNCCHQMFYSSGLKNLELHNLDAPTDSTATDGWLLQVGGSNRKISQPELATWDQSTVNMHIPQGWAVNKRIIRYTVAFSANDPLRCNLSGAGQYAPNDTVSLTVSNIAPHYSIGSWYDNDAQEAIQVQGNSYIFSATEDRDITVNLAEDPYVTITTEVSPNDIGATITGGGKQYIGETVTLTANYNHDYYALDHWSNGETGDTITFTATTDASYTCYLKYIKVIVSGTTGDESGATIGGLGVYNEGEQVKISPKGKLRNGYTFDKWKVEQSGTTTYYTDKEITITADAYTFITLYSKQGIDDSLDFFTIEFLRGHGNFGINNSNWHGWYKKNDGQWTEYTQPVSVTTGDKIKLAGSPNDGYTVGLQCIGTQDFADGEDTYYDFANYGKVRSFFSLPGNHSLKVYGHLTSLVNTNCYDSDEGDFRNLFAMRRIADASGLVFPRQNLYSDYTGMFAFSELETEEALMPKDYSSIKLPSNAVPGGFEYMFAQHRFIEKSPRLRARNLTEDCYKGMFYGCSALTSVRTEQLTKMDPYNQSNWLSEVSETGTIYFNQAINWNPEIYRGAEGTQIYGYPQKWNYSFASIDGIDTDLGLDGLYINDQRVDEFIDMDVSMTYQSRDTSNPEAVRSSFSKTVELPGTQNNNKIFGQLYNVNATLTTFNPKERVEFKLYRNSEIIEKGYITLDEINNNNGNITYNITLYGGLGDFFYSLMYDEEGNEKTMDKLNYNLDMLNSHLLTFWDFEHIKTGWDKLSNPFDPTDRTPENFIVACPTYGGFGDEMDNDKAVLLSRWYNGPTDEYGYSFRHGPVSWDYTPDSGSTFYTDKNGWIPLECQREMSEWETRDFRSSQQRPAIRTKLLFDAICNPENNGGWNVEVSPSVSADTYINDSWIVCDRLQFEDGESNLNPIIVRSYMDREVLATVAPAVQMTEDEDEFDFSDMTNVHMRLCAYPMVYITNNQFVKDDSVRKIFTAFEARAFLRDQDNQYVSGYTPEWSESQHRYVPSTNPANAYHKFDQVYLANAFVFWMTDNYGNRSNIVVLMNHLLKNDFFWVEDEYREYIAEHYSVSTSDVTIYNKNIVKRKNANGDVWFVCEDVMPMTMDCPSNSDVKVQYHFEILDFPWAISSVGKKYDLSDCRYYNGTAPDFGVSYDGQIPSWDWTMDAVNKEAVNGYISPFNITPQHTYDLWTIDDEENNYIGLPTWRWDSFYIASGDDTEDDNFEQSWQAWQPVRFHNTFVEPIMDTDNEGAGNGYYEGQMSTVQSTSVTKELMFGRLGNAYDFLMTLSKLLSLRFRVDKDDKKVYIERVFEYYQDRTVDITDLVDYSKEIKVIPNVTDYKYLNYELPSPEDLYINKLYKARYHKNYDGYKFNTGVNLNNEVNEILESCPLNSTAEYQMKSPYFILVTEVPQPFLLPTVKETLFLESGGTSSNQTITLEKTGRSSVIRMDSVTGPKMLCMYDNEYKSVDTNMVMAFFNGFIPWKCVVSDNVPAMNELQDKNCIMSMYQHFADDILDVINIPPFSPTPVPIDDGYIYAPPSTKVNTVDRVAVLRDQIPQFTTTLSGKTSLVYPPEHPFTDIGECIYPQYHQWSEDMYDRNGKKVELYMRIPKDIKPNDMLRIFLYWENSIWIVEDIQDYDLTKPDTVKVTLVKVRNKANYLLNE